MEEGCFLSIGAISSQLSGRVMSCLVTTWTYSFRRFACPSGTQTLQNIATWKIHENTIFFFDIFPLLFPNINSSGFPIASHVSFLVSSLQDYPIQTHFIPITYHEILKKITITYPMISYILYPISYILYPIVDDTGRYLSTRNVCLATRCASYRMMRCRSIPSSPSCLRGERRPAPGGFLLI